MVSIARDSSPEHEADVRGVRRGARNPVVAVGARLAPEVAEGQPCVAVFGCPDGHLEAAVEAFRSPRYSVHHRRLPRPGAVRHRQERGRHRRRHRGGLAAGRESYDKKELRIHQGRPRAGRPAGGGRGTPETASGWPGWATSWSPASAAGTGSTGRSSAPAPTRSGPRRRWRPRHDGRGRRVGTRRPRPGGAPRPRPRRARGRVPGDPRGSPPESILETVR